MAVSAVDLRREAYPGRPERAGAASIWEEDGRPGGGDASDELRTWRTSEA